jgi:hypothetical protein
MYAINIKQKMNKFKVKFSKRYQKKKHQLSKKKGSYLSKKKKILKGGAPGVHMMKLVDSSELQELQFQLSDRYGSGVSPEQFNNLCEEVFTQELLDELNARRDNKPELIEYRTNNIEFFSRTYPIISKGISKARFRHKTFKAIDEFITANMIIPRCTLDTLFDEPWIPGKCVIPEEYKGTCGYPTLETVYLEYPEDYIESIFNLLTEVSKKLEPGQSIGIILGALRDDEFRYTYDVNLYFNMCVDLSWQNPNCDTFENIDKILEEIRSGSQLNKDYRIDAFFPLTTHPTHIKLLDLILELTTRFKIALVNSMCGTCFGSFYYLKKRARQNFTYITKHTSKHPTGEVYEQKDRDTDNCYTGPYNNFSDR